MEYRTLAQVLSLATRARQVLLGLLSRQGERPSPYLLGGYHCIHISIYKYLWHFSAVFSLSDSQTPEWLFSLLASSGSPRRKGQVCKR